MPPRTLMSVGWPAFLAACLLELLVFGFVDPQELHGLGSEGGLSRQTIYTLAFLAFWLIAAAAVTLGVVLSRDDQTTAGES